MLCCIQPRSRSDEGQDLQHKATDESAGDHLLLVSCDGACCLAEISSSSGRAPFKRGPTDVADSCLEVKLLAEGDAVRLALRVCDCGPSNTLLQSEAAPAAVAADAVITAPPTIRPEACCSPSSSAGDAGPPGQQVNTSSTQPDSSSSRSSDCRRSGEAAAEEAVESGAAGSQKSSGEEQASEAAVAAGSAPGTATGTEAAEAAATAAEASRCQPVDRGVGTADEGSWRHARLAERLQQLQLLQPPDTECSGPYSSGARSQVADAAAEHSPAALAAAGDEHSYLNLLSPKSGSECGWAAADCDGRDSLVAGLPWEDGAAPSEAAAGTDAEALTTGAVAQAVYVARAAGFVSEDLTAAVATPSTSSKQLVPAEQEEAAAASCHTPGRSSSSSSSSVRGRGSRRSSIAAGASSSSGRRSGSVSGRGGRACRQQQQLQQPHSLCSVTDTLLLQLASAAAAATNQQQQQGTPAVAAGAGCSACPSGSSLCSSNGRQQATQTPSSSGSGAAATQGRHSRSGSGSNSRGCDVLLSATRRSLLLQQVSAALAAGAELEQLLQQCSQQPHPGYSTHSLERQQQPEHSQRSLQRGGQASRTSTEPVSPGSSFMHRDASVFARYCQQPADKQPEPQQTPQVAADRQQQQQHEDVLLEPAELPSQLPNLSSGLLSSAAPLEGTGSWQQTKGGCGLQAFVYDSQLQAWQQQQRHGSPHLQTNPCFSAQLEDAAAPAGAAWPDADADADGTEQQPLMFQDCETVVLTSAQSDGLSLAAAAVAAAGGSSGSTHSNAPGLAAEPGGTAAAAAGAAGPLSSVGAAGGRTSSTRQEAYQHVRTVLWPEAPADPAAAAAGGHSYAAQRQRQSCNHDGHVCSIPFSQTAARAAMRVSFCPCCNPGRVTATGRDSAGTGFPRSSSLYSSGLLPESFALLGHHQCHQQEPAAAPAPAPADNAVGTAGPAAAADAGHEVQQSAAGTKQAAGAEQAQGSSSVAADAGPAAALPPAVAAAAGATSAVAASAATKLRLKPDAGTRHADSGGSIRAHTPSRHKEAATGSSSRRPEQSASPARQHPPLPATKGSKSKQAMAARGSSRSPDLAAVVHLYQQQQPEREQQQQEREQREREQREREQRQREREREQQPRERERERERQKPSKHSSERPASPASQPCLTPACHAAQPQPEAVAACGSNTTAAGAGAAAAVDALQHTVRPGVSSAVWGSSRCSSSSSPTSASRTSAAAGLGAPKRDAASNCGSSRHASSGSGTSSSGAPAARWLSPNSNRPAAGRSAAHNNGGAPPEALQTKPPAAAQAAVAAEGASSARSKRQHAAGQVMRGTASKQLAQRPATSTQQHVSSKPAGSGATKPRQARQPPLQQRPWRLQGKEDERGAAAAAGSKGAAADEGSDEADETEVSAAAAAATPAAAAVVPSLAADAAVASTLAAEALPAATAAPGAPAAVGLSLHSDIPTAGASRSNSSLLHSIHWADDVVASVATFDPAAAPTSLATHAGKHTSQHSRSGCGGGSGGGTAGSRKAQAQLRRAGSAAQAARPAAKTVRPASAPAWMVRQPRLQSSHAVASVDAAAGPGSSAESVVSSAAIARAASVDSQGAPAKRSALHGRQAPVAGANTAWVHPHGAAASVEPLSSATAFAAASGAEGMGCLTSNKRAAASSSTRGRRELAVISGGRTVSPAAGCRDSSSSSSRRHAVASDTAQAHSDGAPSAVGWPTAASRVAATSDAAAAASSISCYISSATSAAAASGASAARPASSFGMGLAAISIPSPTPSAIDPEHSRNVLLHSCPAGAFGAPKAFPATPASAGGRLWTGGGSAAESDPGAGQGSAAAGAVADGLSGILSLVRQLQGNLQGLTSDVQQLHGALHRRSSTLGDVTDTSRSLSSTPFLHGDRLASTT